LCTQPWHTFARRGYTDRITERALELLQKALALTEEERAELAGSLIETLDGCADADAESAWNQEIARRVAETPAARKRFLGKKCKNGTPQN
jgi:hypothetical protein